MDNFLQEQFNKDIEQSIKESEKNGYNPKIFKIMFYETYHRDGVQLANILINKGQTYGFEELYKIGRLDLTIEARVLKTEFSSLFDETTLKKAKRKLAQLGYEQKEAFQEKITTNKYDILREQFYQYLVKEGFSDRTPTGNPSTTYDYTKRIERVCKEESLSWEELLNSIDIIVTQYDKGGTKEELGKQSKSAVINALKQYQLFAAEQGSKTKPSLMIPDVPYYEGNTVERTILQKTRNQEIVKAVKERDNYTCRGCNFNFNNKIVEAHHLVPIANTDREKQVKKDDLITLCPNCHAIAHILLKQDEKYQKLENLIYKLQEIYKIKR